MGKVELDNTTICLIIIVMLLGQHMRWAVRSYCASRFVQPHRAVMLQELGLQ
jgi:hypothetical protein